MSLSWTASRSGTLRLKEGGVGVARFLLELTFHKKTYTYVTYFLSYIRRGVEAANAPTWSWRRRTPPPLTRMPACLPACQPATHALA